MHDFKISQPVYLVQNEDAGIFTILAFPVVGGEECVEIRSPSGALHVVEVGEIAASRGLPKSDDAINPSHYKGTGLECIDAIAAQLSREEFMGYLRGNVAKYTWRMRQKGDPIENAKKANWYLDRLMKELAQ